MQQFAEVHPLNDVTQRGPPTCRLLAGVTRRFPGSACAVGDSQAQMSSRWRKSRLKHGADSGAPRRPQAAVRALVRRQLVSHHRGEQNRAHELQVRSPLRARTHTHARRKSWLKLPFVSVDVLQISLLPVSGDWTGEFV